MDLERFRKDAHKRQNENRKFLNAMKRRPPVKMDETFATLHEEVFEEIHCLNCANCCKTTPPRLNDRDISRISKLQGMKPGEFTQAYLRIDEDGDYIMKQTPCPFLAPDNTCNIYEDRPKACREYPHTDSRNMHTLLKITYYNTLVCPAVLEIVERMKKVK